MRATSFYRDVGRPYQPGGDHLWQAQLSYGFLLMANHPIDLDTLATTESDPYYNSLWTLIRQKQIAHAALQTFPDADLAYIAGHRLWQEAEQPNVDEGDRVGTQQKVHGNALRAKDELDRRVTLHQLKALEESNISVAQSSLQMRRSAEWTRIMAVGTIVIAIATIVLAYLSWR